MEETIFKALLIEPATSAELTREVYPTRQAEPFNAQIVVNKAVITLGKKLERNREPYRLQRKKLPGERTIENRLVRNKTKLVK